VAILPVLSAGKNTVMKTLRSLLLILAVWPFLPSLADESGWSGFVELSSDYMWRGRTETRHHPAYQGEFDYWDGPFYAGVWYSRVDFGDGGTPIEVDPYVGATIDLDVVQLVLGLGASAYPVQPDHADMNDVEMKIGLTRHFGDLFVSVAANERIDLNVTGPHVTLALGRSQYYEAAVAYDFDTHWKASLGLGAYRGGHDYQQGTGAVQYAFDDHWAVALSYAATTRAELGVFYDPSLAFSIKFTL
jgi:uncharacterized protein (TIGR02001 family)